jgi:hypothetical protein
MSIIQLAKPFSATGRKLERCATFLNNSKGKWNKVQKNPSFSLQLSVIFNRTHLSIWSNLQNKMHLSKYNKNL